MGLEVYVTIAVVIALVMFLGVGIYVYVRDKTLEEIRGKVYELFLVAEHTYTETKAGKQKMKWVISKARGLLPKWAQFFIDEELLMEIIQLWFDAVKDLLDDGKYNHSTEEEEQEEE